MGNRGQTDAPLFKLTEKSKLSPPYTKTRSRRRRCGLFYPGDLRKDGEKGRGGVSAVLFSVGKSLLDAEKIPLILLLYATISEIFYTSGYKTVTAPIVIFILSTLISFPFFSRTPQATGLSTKEESYIFPCARTLKSRALSLLNTMGLEEEECTPKGGRQTREEEKGQQASVHTALSHMHNRTSENKNTKQSQVLVCSANNQDSNDPPPSPPSSPELQQILQQGEKEVRTKGSCKKNWQV